MKVEFLEVTIPEPETSEDYQVGRNGWEPIIAKVDYKYSKEVGLQLQKQIEVLDSKTRSANDYKFECVVNGYLLEGCWLNDVDFASPDFHDPFPPITLTIRYDNATELPSST